MSLTDKTGAPVDVTRGDGRFTIAVEGKPVGLTEFADFGDLRVFPHTEVDEAYGGRGLGTLVIEQALAQTRAEGMRIVPVCPMVQAFTDEHPEYAAVVAKPTREIAAWLRERG